jgi:hypothetical protein
MNTLIFVVVVVSSVLIMCAAVVAIVVCMCRRDSRQGRPPHHQSTQQQPPNASFPCKSRTYWHRSDGNSTDMIHISANYCIPFKHLSKARNESCILSRSGFGRSCYRGPFVVITTVRTRERSQFYSRYSSVFSSPYHPNRLWDQHSLLSCVSKGNLSHGLRPRYMSLATQQ